MKKQIIIAAVALGAFVFASTNAQAQEASAQAGKTTNPVSTTVNITLGDVISIETGNNATVDFSYTTSADYNKTKEQTIENNIKVTSSSNFNINVKAGGTDFRYGTVGSIPVSVLDIKAVEGGSMDGTYKTINLTDSDQVLVENATLGAQKTLNINYSISDKKAQEVLLGKPAGNYTQEVKYTATAL